MRLMAVVATLALAATAATAGAQAVRPDQLQFRALYQEMVETDTSVTTGSCTALADKIEAHLRQTGFAAADVARFAVADHPKEGGLIAILPGTSTSLKPILLLGHLDVVAAKREDWTRDPYRMVEENGYFYGRGTADMKVIDAIWVDSMMRMKRDGYRPKRTVKLALTCGEETTWAFNGARWLAENRPELIAAEFALNEGGGGDTDGHGKLLIQEMQVGEKAVQNYRLETFNPGGHSSIPVPDNAIAELATALTKVAAYEFPVEMTDTTRTFFAETGKTRSDDIGRAMRALAANPNDAAAEKMVSTDRMYHSMLRTTCVTTLIEGGHANNALPQHAQANVNCRIFPGHTPDEIQARLVAIVGDAKVKITALPPIRPLAKAPPLDPKVMGPAIRLAARYFPGVPVIPSMATGATDGIFLEAIGIPTYGVPGPWGDPDGNGVHGLNERQEVRSAYVGRDYLFDLIKAYAGS